MNAYSKHDDEFKEKKIERLTDRTNNSEKSEQKKGDPLKRVPTYGFYIISTDLRKTITQEGTGRNEYVIEYFCALCGDVPQLFDFNIFLHVVFGANKYLELNFFLYFIDHKKASNVYIFFSHILYRQTDNFFLLLLKMYFGYCFVSNCLQIIKDSRSIKFDVD